jgi:hypothetical protein
MSQYSAAVAAVVAQCVVQQCVHEARVRTVLHANSVAVAQYARQGTCAHTVYGESIAVAAYMQVTLRVTAIACCCTVAYMHKFHASINLYASQ